MRSRILIFWSRKRFRNSQQRTGSGREVLIWSAGCSTGEEPYTLAMVLNEYRQSHPGFRFRVLATDISTASLGQG